jgi:hypothetical protein
MVGNCVQLSVCTYKVFLTIEIVMTRFKQISLPVVSTRAEFGWTSCEPVPDSYFGILLQRLSGEAREASKVLAATGKLPEEMLANLTEEEVAILMEQKAAVEEAMLTEEEKAKASQRGTNMLQMHIVGQYCQRCLLSLLVYPQRSRHARSGPAYGATDVRLIGETETAHPHHPFSRLITRHVLQ